ncbi:FecCD family ABC transporter permease [Sphingomonas japonica]|uniref:Iron complex transport system permease protein n=1 Tax=Sphingomonas japonica TaxID=511662 RepID=A0ABX0TYH7_9SPHN|nr:iron ABC transporter permease [Sphingomonas japonica]NIJ22566.1 iron complex transport system permease protein [Sphingomonas japonica]
MTRPRILLALTLAATLAAALSLMAGKTWVPFDAWWSTDPRWWIIFDLRVPRTLLALMIGAVLGLSGAVLQGYLRNPLADPGLVGVSSAAAFGAVTAIFFGIGGSVWMLAGSAMAAAALSVALLAFLVGRSASAVSFILAGTILSALAAALTTLLISIAPNPFATAEIVTWLMGALTDRGYDEIVFAAPFMALGALLLLTTGRTLDALALGEDVARSMGISIPRLQAIIALGLGLGVGASVAVTGVVGFVGLIVPHIVRPLVGQKPSALLVPSMLAGALLLTIADSLVRMTPGAGELKLGVAMALIGAPFFFWLLWRYRRHMA